QARSGDRHNARAPEHHGSDAQSRWCGRPAQDGGGRSPAAGAGAAAAPFAQSGGVAKASARSLGIRHAFDQGRRGDRVLSDPQGGRREQGDSGNAIDPADAGGRCNGPAEIEPPCGSRHILLQPGGSRAGSCRGGWPMSQPSHEGKSKSGAGSQESGASSYFQILRSTVLIGGSSAFAIVFAIIRNKAAAVLVGPEGFGLMSLYSALLELSQGIASLGLQSSGVRQIAEAAGAGDME